MVTLDNLPGVKGLKNDGNLVPEATVSAPKVLVVGTAGQGAGHQEYRVQTTSQAKVEFSTDGTLLRGMWESVAGGAEEVSLYRVGSKAAKVEGIGDSTGSAGYTVQTVDEDATAGDLYSIWFDDSADQLVVYRVADDLIVYDKANEIDYGFVTVSGFRAAGGGPDIGTSSAPVTMSSIDPSTYAGTSYTAGTDGLSLSRMELYEELYVAYKDLFQATFDVLLPMDVYLDDYNTVDHGHYLGAQTPVALSANSYPTANAFSPGTDMDALGMLYVEEYEGQFYFWWRFATSGTTADIFPTGVGSASATTKIDGTALASSDFHEVNFAYQMARFLYDYTTYIVDATGNIGVLPPVSNSLVDKSRWVGRAPTWSINSSDGEFYIANPGDDGSGLLGNKFMVGRYAHRAGVYGGGFIATDGEFMDSGAEITDSNDVPVDLGKFINVVADYPVLRNSFSSTPYIATLAATYGGFYSNRSPASAPTNKPIPNVSIFYKTSLQTLDSLVGAGYVTLRAKATGTVITDAPTAALPNSDWWRLSTVRIVKAVVDGIRGAADPFLGEAINATKRQALETAIDEVLMSAKQAGYLQDYRPFKVNQTPDQQVRGVATVDLVLIPAFELRQIEVTVSLSKSA
jgi:hypothetical protein